MRICGFSCEAEFFKSTLLFLFDFVSSSASLYAPLFKYLVCCLQTYIRYCRIVSSSLVLPNSQPVKSGTMARVRCLPSWLYDYIDMFSSSTLLSSRYSHFSPLLFSQLPRSLSKAPISSIVSMESVFKSLVLRKRWIYNMMIKILTYTIATNLVDLLVSILVLVKIH